LAIDSESVHLPIKKLETITVVAKFLMNNKRYDPQGIKLSVFPLRLMGFVPLQYWVTHTEFFFPYILLVKPSLDAIMMKSIFFIFLSCFISIALRVCLSYFEPKYKAYPKTLMKFEGKVGKCS